MNKINRLLKSKKVAPTSWTGEELAHIQIARLLDLFYQSCNLNGKIEAFIKEDFKELLSTINDKPEEIKIYNNFMDMHAWWINFYETAKTYEQQAALNFNILNGAILNARVAEEVYSYVYTLLSNLSYKDKMQQFIKDHSRKEIISGKEVLILDSDPWETPHPRNRPLSNLDLIDKNYYDAVKDMPIADYRNGMDIIKNSDSLTKKPFLKNNNREDISIGRGIEATLSDFSLQAYFSENPNCQKNTECIMDARKTFIDSYYFLQGYNKAIDLIKEIFHIEEYERAKINMNYFETAINSFNSSRACVLSAVINQTYDDSYMKNKKIDILKSLLYDISVDDLEIPEAQINQVKKDMKSFEAFKNEFKNPKNIICYRD